MLRFEYVVKQDMCLYLQLTILENFRVYGYLFGISEKDILARAKNLVSFLELPSENTFIDNLR